MLQCQTEASFASLFMFSLFFSLQHNTLPLSFTLTTSHMFSALKLVFVIAESIFPSVLRLWNLAAKKGTIQNNYECHHEAKVSYIGIWFYHSLCNSPTQSLRNVTANYFASRLARDEVPIIWMRQTLKLTALSVPWLRLCPCWCKFMPLRGFSAPLFTQ